MYYPLVQPLTTQQRRFMTVTGLGSVLVEPDSAQIQFEVITENSQLEKAQQQNAIVMNQVIKSLLDIGINKEDIKTNAYTIFPQYDYPEGKQQFRTYQVTNAITVKIMDIEKIGTTIDVAVQNGVSNASSIQFMIGNKDYYYQQALSLALKDALAKAQVIAQTMGLQLDQTPIKIIEESREAPVLFHSFAAKELNVSTPIEPGQQSIDATVNVQFQY